LVVQACRETGVSVSSVAQRHDLTPSLVWRWLNLDSSRIHLSGAKPNSGLSPTPAAASTDSFVAVQVRDRLATAAPIHLELRRGATVVVVDWPAQEAASCGAWLGEWLR
jgi:transposase-like protein